MCLKDKVRKLPSTPGVYLMKDSKGCIIYVGKAINLKRRVQSYFQNSGSHSPKTIKLIHNIKDFEVLHTDTEFEAFMLECKLIQELKPYFNKKMKNPKSYTFITIQKDDEYPVLEVANEGISNGRNLIFGPYISKHMVEKAVQGLKEFYKINCSHLSKRKTPCLNYSLGLCRGMCFSDTALEQYKNIIHQISRLLNGTDLSPLDEMKQLMESAAENLQFTEAAKYRDYIDSLNFLLYKEEMIAFTEDNQNIAILEYLTESSFKLFLIKRNKMLLSQKFSLESCHFEELIPMIKKDMIHYFKENEPDSVLEISKEEIDKAQIIYSYIKSGSCNYCVIPEKYLSLDNQELDASIKKLEGQSPVILQ